MAKKKAATLKTLLAPAKLKSYGWNRSYERGEEYYHAGAVSSLVQYGDRINAVVNGNRAYKANIRFAGTSLSFDCTCPAGGFCKHLIAAALAWNNGEAEMLGSLDDITAPAGKLSAARGKKGAPDIRSYLLSLDKERLADMVLEQAVGDAKLRERLAVAATVANPDGVDLTALRRRIDAALVFPDFDYENPYWDEEYPYAGYAEQLQPILEALESLLGKSQYESVIKLIEYALAELNKRCLEMEYDFLDPEEMIDPLIALHLRACAKTKPDPESLAEWLFHLGIVGAAGEFPGLPWERYEKLLGKKGGVHFRRLVGAEWEKIPTLSKKDGGDPHRLLRERLRDVMLRFAEEDNDVDAQAAIIKKDLTCQHAYLELACAYRSAKLYDEALHWAEKGWDGFPDSFRRDSELRDFLATEYRRRKRTRDATILYWNDFCKDMCLHTYQRLKKEASHDKSWPEWREKAIAGIREKIAHAKKNRPKRQSYSFGSYDDDFLGRMYDNSLLVEILLWEKKEQEAWDEAVSGGCAEALWLRLSDWREKSRPEDCIPIWEKRIERLTRIANQSDYVPAAESLAKLGELMKKTGEQETFDEKIRAIRESLK